MAWQELLDRRGSVVYMHPPAPRCCAGLHDSVPTQMNESEFDITRGCTSLLANGMLHKYPRVKIIIPPLGGAMPMIAGRIQNRYPHDPKHDEYVPNDTLSESQTRSTPQRETMPASAGTRARGEAGGCGKDFRCLADPDSALSTC